MGLEIDRTMNNIENKLSDISAYPVVGTLAGVTKILLGTTQALTGLACGIMLLIPSAATRDWSSMKSSWTHIKHGVGNMTAGVFESIPFVQTAIYGIRRMKQGEISDIHAHLYTGHEFKFMPYKSLVERDWKIGGADDEAVEKAKDIFNKKITDYSNPQDLSEKIKYRLAAQAVEEENTLGKQK